MKYKIKSTFKREKTGDMNKLKEGEIESTSHQPRTKAIIYFPSLNQVEFNGS